VSEKSIFICIYDTGDESERKTMKEGSAYNNQQRYPKPVLIRSLAQGYIPPGLAKLLWELLLGLYLDVLAASLCFTFLTLELTSLPEFPHLT